MLEKKLTKKVLEIVYALGESTAKSFTRLNAYEPMEDAEVYRILKEKTEEKHN